MKKKVFPIFWFEGGMSFGWVKSLKDLREVVRRYEGQMTKDEILDKAHDVPEDATAHWSAPEHNPKYPNFGLRREHSGKRTLREFLLKNKIDF